MAKQIKSVATLVALFLVAWAVPAAAANVDIGAVTHYLGDGTKSGAADGSGSDAKFNRPLSCVVHDDTLLITDNANHAIRAVSLPGNTVETVIGKLKSPGDTFSSGTNARLGTPESLVLNGDVLYFTDSSKHVVLKVTGSDYDLDVWAGNTLPGYANGAGGTARFNGTAGLALGEDGELFVVERNVNRVRRIASDQEVTLLAGSETGLAGDVDGTRVVARFNEPNGVAYHDGVVYVADTGNQKIRAIDRVSGVVTTVAGTGAVGHNDGAAATATFVEPFGLAVHDGVLFITDKGNNVVRRLNLDTNVVDTVVGNLEAGWRTDTKSSVKGRIKSPTGLCFSSTRMYVTGDHSLAYVVLGDDDTPVPEGSDSATASSDDGSETDAPEPAGSETDAPDGSSVDSEEGSDDSEATTRSPDGDVGSASMHGTAAAFAAVAAATMVLLA